MSKDEAMRVLSEDNQKPPSKVRITVVLAGYGTCGSTKARFTVAPPV